MKTTKELADQVRDTEYLKSKGWIKVPCDNPNCTEHRLRFRCLRCDNKGFNWQSPLTC